RKPAPMPSRPRWRDGRRDLHLPEPKSGLPDFGLSIKRPNPRYSEVRLGGGRPTSASRVGTKTRPHFRRGPITSPRTTFGGPTLSLQGRVRQAGMLFVPVQALRSTNSKPTPY